VTCYMNHTDKKKDNRKKGRGHVAKRGSATLNSVSAHV